MARTTQARLNALANKIHTRSVELGIMPEGCGTTLNIGNKTNGIAYRLCLRKPGETGDYPHPAYRSGVGYLGMTPGEADNTLGVIAEVLDCVRWELIRGERKS